MSISNKLSRYEIENIYSAANSSIWHSHNFANINAKNKVREEDFVAALVSNGIPILTQRCISILQPKGVFLRISGVFCHGHPRVKFGNNNPIELADLLIVHQHIGLTRSSGRALLIQAKMSDDSTHRLPSGDTQLKLFSTWPPFKFITGGLPTQLRNIDEKGKGSRYALVLNDHSYPEDITWADQCPWSTCEAKQILTSDISLAKIIGNMLLGKEGRAFELTNKKNEWSQLIHDLLTITGERTYTRNNISINNMSRLTGIESRAPGMMFLSASHNYTSLPEHFINKTLTERFFTNKPSYNNSSDIPSEEINREQPEGGISTIIIETIDIEKINKR